jgi:hypothetical protein
MHVSLSRSILSQAKRARSDDQEHGFRNMPGPRGRVHLKKSFNLRLLFTDSQILQTNDPSDITDRRSYEYVLYQAAPAVDIHGANVH